MTNSRSRREALKLLGSISLGSMAFGRYALAEADKPMPGAVPASLVKDVRERIASGLAQGESTGVALALVEDGRVLWEEGFGWSDKVADKKITPHSAFNLESVTKPFSTTLITTLAADGKIDLDQPGNRYLIGNKIRGNNGDPEQATVRRLGAHCSGLPGTFEAIYHGPSPSADVFLGRFGRLAFPPGEVWEYSNVGFEALGGIAHDLTQRDFGSLMEERVLAPLGMKDSFWDTNPRVAHSVPRYDLAGKKLPFHLTTTPPSGELLSSAHDLARFAIWNMKLPLPGGGRLLTDRWIDELHRPAFTGPNGQISTFGWARHRLSSGETVIHKGGGGPGASTTICLVPERKLACIVLNNHYTPKFTDAVCDRIMSSYLPAWTTLEENGQPNSMPFRMSRTVTGTWRGNLMNDGIDITAELKVLSDNEATLSLAGGPALKLTNLQSQDTFFLADATGTIHSEDPITRTANALRLKLVPSEGRLVGRLNAMDMTIDHQGGIPFVLNLSRAT